MSKIRVGNKQNSILNGEWAGHVRKRLGMKRITAHIRRYRQRKITLLALEEMYQ